MSFDPSLANSTAVTGEGAGDVIVRIFVEMQERYGYDGRDCYWLGYAEPVDYTTPVEVRTRIAKLQYQKDSGYVDVSGTLYVLKGATASFKAVPDPANASFSSEEPVWSGSSGASGAGETKTVTFDTASSSSTDYKTVIATAGNSVTANVIVVDITPTLTPEDNFNGRSLTSFGIHEFITLGFTMTPSGLSAEQIGGLQWQQTSGSGTLDNPPNDGTGSYRVADTAGSATLQLKMMDGPSKDQGPNRNITVATPSGGYVTGSILGMCNFIGR